jgi:hypothetical protein
MTPAIVDTTLFTIDPPQGRSCLPVVELDRTLVAARGKQIARSIDKWEPNADAILTTTFGHANASLSLQSWSFYHAAAKTELARSFLPSDVTENAQGIYLSTRSLLEWDEDNLRLRKGGVFSRKDAARKSYASRFGEAILYLFMINNDYVYWDHLPSLVERAMNKAVINHSEQVRVARAIRSKMKPSDRPMKQPDFAFETAARQVALAEAKGAFVTPGTTAKSLKGDLDYALKQLAAWDSLITPRPTKSFAVGTYFRETGDPSPEPSLIAFVDPNGDDEVQATAVPFPDDWIRRGNYGAWLYGMRLFESATALRNGYAIKLPKRKFLTITIGPRKFAIVLHSLIGTPFLPAFFYHPAFFRWFGDFEQHPDIQILGLDTEILSAIEKAVETADGTVLTVLPTVTLGSDLFPKWLSGSIFPDGSLYGAIHFNHDSMPVPDGIESFRL